MARAAPGPDFTGVRLARTRQRQTVPKRHEDDHDPRGARHAARLPGSQPAPVAHVEGHEAFRPDRAQRLGNANRRTALLARTQPEPVGHGRALWRPAVR